jgi:molybdate transport system substrate-binding protein
VSAVRLLIGISVCVVIMAAGLVRAEDRELTVFAAGSLREAIGAIAEDFGAAHKLQIRTEFGPSGRMRERIERGEQADLFASADIGHARTLVEQGRATVMAMFARNSICALAPEGLGLTEATIVDSCSIRRPESASPRPWSIRSATIPSRFITGSAENMPARQTI